MLIKTLCVFGTRPEAIKMAPLIQQLHANSVFSNKVCITGQHKQMLYSTLESFDVIPDFSLDVMIHNQDLSQLTAKILSGLSNVLNQYHPDLILIHGDTTTTLAGALAAYYHQIPIGHVEAGLRTGHLMTPWPEEANRKLAGVLANFHFAPTELARLNLLREGVSADSIYITGNTVVDAIMGVLERFKKESGLEQKIQQQFKYLDFNRKTILVTGHRRENFGEGLKNICHALAIIAQDFPDINIVYPVHLNPNVQKPVNELLINIPNIYLVAPVDYLSFVYLMKSAYLILTDSGGIQEEAPLLGKPVLVTRDITERFEAVEGGNVKLIGTNSGEIINQIKKLLQDEVLYRQMSSIQRLYGDGDASIKIVEIIQQQFEFRASQRTSMIN